VTFSRPSARCATEIPHNPRRRPQGGSHSLSPRRTARRPHGERKIVDHTRRYRTLFEVLAYTGLRIGEALGLTWADIDFDNAVIHVHRQLDRNRQHAPLKTPASRREVVVAPAIAKLLREHRLASPYKAPHHFVFANAAHSAPTPAWTGRIGTSLGVVWETIKGPTTAIVLLVVVAVIATTVALYNGEEEPAPFSAPQFAQITNGMTTVQVRALLGKPTDDYFAKRQRCWQYGGVLSDSPMYNVCFRHDVVVDKFRSG
jgi:hypothetical protein